MPMHAYVLQGKGPGLTMGFTFLEDNELLVDCVGRVLTTTGKNGTVSYCKCQVAEPRKRVGYGVLVSKEHTLYL